jgi:hypothetical protein
VNDSYHNINYATQKEKQLNTKPKYFIQITIRFLYSSDACSTALSQLARALFKLDVVGTRLRSSCRYRVGRPKAISSSYVKQY